MLNRVVLMGRLTADPDLRQTTGGTSVVSFSIAVDRDFASSGEERQTDFINLVAWRQTAEFISKFFGKGKMIAVEGRIQTRNYTDANGNKRYITEVVVDRAYFADSNKATNNAGGGFSNGPEHPAFSQENSSGSSISIGDIGEFEEIDDDEDVPF